jgi:sulfur carrier protein
VAARTTVARLLSERGLAIDRVAVEINRTIVAKQDYARRELADGDVVEIVSFVGGG